MTEKKLIKWWANIDDESLTKFIENWFAEIDLGDDATSDYGGDVVLMNFLASEKFQWLFILKSFQLAKNEDHMGTLAAGCVEHLLAKHGENWIHKFEEVANKNPEFAHMMCGVWQNSMSDEVWQRVQSIQNSVR
ncbi:MAG: hypothetical protein Alis3KO_41370 [Aliiglaciecola sp.]